MIYAKKFNEYLYNPQKTVDNYLSSLAEVEKQLSPMIISSYNRAYCIRTAIDSLLNQSYKNFELLIVDNASTDDTKNLLIKNYKKYLDSGKIKYFYTKIKGTAHARNIAFSHASKEWIAYLDTDNELLPNFLRNYALSIIKNPQKELSLSTWIKDYCAIMLLIYYEYILFLIRSFIKLIKIQGVIKIRILLDIFSFIS